jgi:polyferredoxin
MNLSSDVRTLLVPSMLLVLFWAVGLVLWRATGYLFYLFNFGYIGTALGVGIGIYALFPKHKKQWGRRAAQFLVGSYMLVFLGLLYKENMQIEGFFFYLLGGVFAGSVIHYLIAKVAGPLVFNRGWCAWACWTAMLLDLLPVKRNSDRDSVPSELGRGWPRYLHFVLSLGLVLALWLVLDYRPEGQAKEELYWLLGGNALYYALGIALAFSFRDSRAFCKYVCPVPVLQKPGSRFALLKVSANAGTCTGCAACSRACPMDIPVHVYVQSGRRVVSSECILCLECVNACSRSVLDVTFGFDAGGKISRARSPQRTA